MRRYTLWISFVGSLLSLSLSAYLFLHFPAQPRAFGSLPFKKYRDLGSVPSPIDDPVGPPRPALFLPENETLISQSASENTFFNKPLFYLIIDDVGADKSLIDNFLELDFPITFAIMPYTQTSVSGYEKILAKKQEPILHMPMEPLNGSFAGRGQIELGDNSLEIQGKIKSALAPYPEIHGFNNHMGSAITSSHPEISTILDYAHAHNLFFVDSFTTADSLSLLLAKERGMQVARRDIFLDNISSEEAINQMLNKALNLASQQKRVVVIGHIWSKELFQVLKKREKELKRLVEFRHISSYFKDMI